MLKHFLFYDATYVTMMHENMVFCNVKLYTFDIMRYYYYYFLDKHLCVFNRKNLFRDFHLKSNRFYIWTITCNKFQFYFASKPKSRGSLHPGT